MVVKGEVGDGLWETSRYLYYTLHKFKKELFMELMEMMGP